MAHRTTWKDKYLGIVIQTILVCGTINISLVFGQSANLAAPALGTNPSGNVFVTYFGDTQSTTAIGATMTLPQCSGTFVGQSNLILRLENSNTGLVLQQVGPFTSQSFILWDTAAIATLTPPLTGSYVCRLYQNSILVATSTLSYQLNVVVPMTITCTFPRPTLFYNSMNMLSCNVIGYPQPMVSWSGINQTILANQPTTLSNGTTTTISTARFHGIEIVSNAGDNVTINITAQYPPINCTSLENPTAQMNFCEAIPKSVTYSRTFRVVGGCPAFNNISWNPSMSAVADYQTSLNISCAAGFTGSSPTNVSCQIDGTWTTFPVCMGHIAAQCGPFNNPVFNSTPSMAMDYTSSFSISCAINYTIPQGSLDINSLTCQANGSWSTLPNCVVNRCHSSPCMDNASKCSVAIDGNFTCSCQAGTTGDGRLPNGCVMVCTDHCDDKNAVCLENGGLRSCRCKAGYTGRAQAASSCVNINECLLSPCQDCLATCMDTEGSFQCLCPSDFQGNGVERGGCSRGPCSALSTGIISGASCGSFFLGIVIASLIAWYLTRRKDGGNASSNSRGTQVGKPPVGMTMTNSDAYGMVDLPSTQQQQPQYDYILPAAQ